jgi:hypothetical protein
MADILADLKSWLDQLHKDRPHLEARGGLPEIDIGKIERAITKIESLEAENKRLKADDDERGAYRPN